MNFNKFFLIVFFITVSFNSRAGLFFQKFEKAAFYNAMALGTLSDIDNELNTIETAPASERDAYEGILLMRKAGLVGKPKEKLRLFKTGRSKFQIAFMADSNNAEFRFLRLGIQEHAPKIVKYRSDINADKIYLKEHFKSLQPVVKRAVIEYSKTSKIIRPEDF